MTDPIRIATVAPIPIDLLQRSFSEDIVFEISAANSKLEPTRLINYLANVSVKHELTIDDNETMEGMINAFMRTNLLYKSPELETLACVLVLRSMGVDIGYSDYSEDELDGYIETIGEDILDLWRIRLSSLEAWSMYVHKPTEDMAREYPVDDKTYDAEGRLRMDGINFIHVLSSPLVDLFIPYINPEDVYFNEDLFTGYIFASKNMFSYCGGPDNPYLLALFDFYNKEEVAEDVPSS